MTGYPLKRILDWTMASIGLVASAPLWLLVPLAIKLNDRGPVFFPQERWGQGGRRIRVLKFRTMVPNADAGGVATQAVRDDPRVTRVGRLLRATALDELPQVLSIWRGDMSFVGPRALPVNEVQQREEQGDLPDEAVPGFRERLRVKPGLTGIAQIYAPRDIGRRQKFRYDHLYIARQSLGLDLYLIAVSVLISVSGRWEVTRRRRRRLGRRGRRGPRGR